MKTLNNLYVSIILLILSTILLLDYRIPSVIAGMICLAIGLLYLSIVLNKITFFVNRIHTLEGDFIMANKTIATLEEQKALLVKQKELMKSLLNTQESLLSDNQKIINRQDEIINSYKLIVQTEQEKCVTDKKITDEFVQLQHHL